MEPATDPEFDKLLTYPHGDAFSGFDFDYKLPGGVPPASNLDRVVMQFRTSLLDETRASVVQTISTDDSDEITITSAANWTGTVKQQMLTKLKVGTYYWGLSFEDVAGNISTLAQGKVVVAPMVVVSI